MHRRKGLGLQKNASLSKRLGGNLAPMVAHKTATKQRSTKLVRVREQKQTLMGILDGSLPPETGMADCCCRAQVGCPQCGKTRACWVAPAWLWGVLSPRLRAMTLCQECYVEWLTLLLEGRWQRGLPLIGRR